MLLQMAAPADTAIPEATGVVNAAPDTAGVQPMAQGLAVGLDPLPVLSAPLTLPVSVIA